MYFTQPSHASADFVCSGVAVLAYGAAVSRSVQVGRDRVAVRRGQVAGGRDGRVHGAQARARAVQLGRLRRAVEAAVQVLVHGRRQLHLQVSPDPRVPPSRLSLSGYRP